MDEAMQLTSPINTINFITRKVNQKWNNNTRSTKEARN